MKNEKSSKFDFLRKNQKNHAKYIFSMIFPIPLLSRAESIRELNEIPAWYFWCFPGVSVLTQVWLNHTIGLQLNHNQAEVGATA